MTKNVFIRNNNYNNFKSIEEYPWISGLRAEYNVGETVNANCTSSKKTFRTSLVWFINDEKVEYAKVRHKNMIFMYVNTHNISINSPVQ